MSEPNNKFKCGCSKEEYQKILTEAENWERNKKKKMKKILAMEQHPECQGHESSPFTQRSTYIYSTGGIGDTYLACPKDCGNMYKKITEFGDEKELSHVCNKKDDNPRERKSEQTELLAYFKKNNIKSIKLENNKLVIKYNDSQTESKEIDNQELQAIKSYAEKLGKSELSLKDLEQSNNPSQTPKSNKVLWWGLGIVGVLVVGVVVWLLVKNKNKHYD